MKIDRILEKIAIQNGVSVSEVRSEMQHAIDEGMKNPDPKVQEYWSAIPHKSEKPTLEEVLVHLTKKAKKKSM